MNIRTPLENSIPPLKKLFKVIVNLMRRMESDPTHAFPKNRIPVPTKDFKSYTTGMSTLLHMITGIEHTMRTACVTVASP